MQISRRKMMEKQKLLNVYYKNKYLLDVDMKAMAFARHLTINQILLTSPQSHDKNVSLACETK